MDDKKLLEGKKEPLEYFRLFRDYREAEHKLLDNRITWNLNIQGFLFLSYGYCVQKAVEVSLHCPDKSSDFSQYFKQLTFLYGAVIPLVGFSLSFFVFIAVWGTQAALDNLRTEWNSLNRAQDWKSDLYLDPKYVLSPVGGGSKWVSLLSPLPPLGIPLALGAAWIFIACPNFKAIPIVTAFALFTLFLEIKSWLGSDKINSTDPAVKHQG